MARALHNLSQAIHQDQIDPPAKFFLHSTVTADDDGEFWEVRLYGTVEGKMEVWLSRIALDSVPAEETVLAQAIKNGMLHLDIKGKKKVAHGSKLALQFLRPDDDPVSIPLAPVTDPGGQRAGNEALLDAALSLVARPIAGGKTDKAEMRGLRAQIDQKDEEIAALHTKMASLKATVVRATASDNNRKKVQASPKKPAGASAMQPNAKRRKAVEDEFAGSSDDESERDSE